MPIRISKSWNAFGFSSFAKITNRPSSHFSESDSKHECISRYVNKNFTGDFRAVKGPLSPYVYFATFHVKERGFRGGKKTFLFGSLAKAQVLGKVHFGEKEAEHITSFTPDCKTQGRKRPKRNFQSSFFFQFCEWHEEYKIENTITFASFFSGICKNMQDLCIFRILTVYIWNLLKFYISNWRECRVSMTDKFILWRYVVQNKDVILRSLKCFQRPDLHRKF